MSNLENNKHLFQKITELIYSANAYINKTINSTILMLYWNIGKVVQTEIVKAERADYGKGIIDGLSFKLTNEYGRGYSRSNLNRMIEFFKYFPDQEILITVLSQLSWSHLVEIIKQKDTLKREFYITMCINEGWSVRKLSDRVNSMLYERTAISNKPDETIYNDLKQLRENKEMSVDLFLKDPYILDFLGLKRHLFGKGSRNFHTRPASEFNFRIWQRLCLFSQAKTHNY